MRAALTCLATVVMIALSGSVFGQGEKQCTAEGDQARKEADKPRTVKQEPFQNLASTSQRQAAFVALLAVLSGKR